MDPVLAQGGVQIRERTGMDCVASDGFCPDWIVNNIGDYMEPLARHVYLTVVAVAIGFAVAFALAILAHRQRWTTGPIIVITGALFTVPSIAAFLLLIPIIGFGAGTAIAALVAYTLLILFRNITTGLREVPPETVDAARGMGMTDRQILRKVELPLALPVVMAGLRIAFTTTVGLAAFATFAGAGGLGENILTESAGTGGPDFQSNVVVAGGLCVLLAALGDVIFLGVQRVLTRWQRVGPA